MVTPEDISDMASRISVVIPVKGGGDDFRRCLDGLGRTEPAPGEIIVVEDGDVEGYGQRVSNHRIRTIRLPERSGPARARNEGAEAAKGDILFFLDADVIVGTDAVGEVAAAFCGDDGLAAVFGSYDDRPAGKNFLSQYRNLFHHYIHQTAEEEASTFWAGCGAVRKAVFFQVGGFDRRYRHPSIEDIELGYRLRREGFRIRLIKSLQVRHLKQWHWRTLLKTDFLFRALPWARLILETGRFPDDLNLKWSNRISVCLIYLIPISLGGSLWRTEILGLSGLLLLFFIMINLPLYFFFIRKRGLRFTALAVIWHGLYYLLCGLAFALGSFRYWLSRMGRTTDRNDSATEPHET